MYFSIWLSFNEKQQIHASMRVTINGSAHHDHTHSLDASVEVRAELARRTVIAVYLCLYGVASAV